MTDILTISSEGAQFADRLRDMLEDRGVAFGQDPMDDVGLIPAYVLAGASVTTDAHAHGDDVHVVSIAVRVADELTEPFYATLDQLLSGAEEAEIGEEHG